MPLSERMNAELNNLIFFNCVSIRDLSHWVAYLNTSRPTYSLFLCVDALRPSQQFFNHVGKISRFPVFLLLFDLFLYVPSTTFQL